MQLPPSYVFCQKHAGARSYCFCAIVHDVYHISSEFMSPYRLVHKTNNWHYITPSWSSPRARRYATVISHRTIHLSQRSNKFATGSPIFMAKSEVDGTDVLPTSAPRYIHVCYVVQSCSLQFIESGIAIRFGHSPYWRLLSLMSFYFPTRFSLRMCFWHISCHPDSLPILKSDGPYRKRQINGSMIITEFHRALHNAFSFSL